MKQIKQDDEFGLSHTADIKCLLLRLSVGQMSVSVYAMQLYCCC